MRRFTELSWSWRSTRSRVLSVAAGALVSVASLAAPSYAGTVTFGSGSNQFNMEFKTIGNPGNAADTDTNARPLNAGAVAYTYDIGKFEVSRDMVTKYNATSGVVAISLDNMTGITGGTGANKPATGISWNEAARFVNWLNTSTGGFAAYNFTTGGVYDDIELWTAADTLDYDAANPYRSLRAKYVLPSYNEWYKAAYYNPTNSTYYDFPTGSNSAPTSVASGTGTGGNGNNEAVYNFQDGPADVDKAGGLSPYGVMGLGGNANEWEESSGDLANSSGSSSRGIRGGDWVINSDLLSSSTRNDFNPSSEFGSLGFRVASLSSDAVVPEPSMMVIGMVFGLGGLAAKRRLKK